MCAYAHQRYSDFARPAFLFVGSETALYKRQRLGLAPALDLGRERLVGYAIVMAAITD